MDTVMPPNALLEVLSAVAGFDPLDNDERWAKRSVSSVIRRDVIALIGRHPFGVEAGYRDVAHRLGRKSDRHVADALNELHARGVLVIARERGGSRGRWWRVNPFIGEWRAMRWRVDPRDLITRAFGGDVVACSEIYCRDPGRGIGDLAPRTGSRRNERPPRLVPRTGSRRNAEDMPDPGRGTNDQFAPSSSSLLGGGGGDAVVDPSSSTSQKEKRGAEPYEFRSVAKAIVRAAGRMPRRRTPALYGEAREEALELWTTYGTERILELLPDAPVEFMAPLIVKWLGEQLAETLIEFDEADQALMEWSDYVDDLESPGETWAIPAPAAPDPYRELREEEAAAVDPERAHEISETIRKSFLSAGAE